MCEVWSLKSKYASMYETWLLSCTYKSTTVMYGCYKAHISLYVRCKWYKTPICLWLNYGCRKAPISLCVRCKCYKTPICLWLNYGCHKAPISLCVRCKCCKAPTHI